MREVAIFCPECGRRSHRSVDAWAGLPDAELGNRVCARCRALAELPALLWAVAIVVALVVGVVEAISL